MSQAMSEELSEREQKGLEHLRQAKALGVSLAEYCRRFELDLNLWYRVKQKLVRKGLAEKGEACKVVKSAAVEKTAARQQRAFARVHIAAAPSPVAVKSLLAAVDTPMACRIEHPCGWVLECSSLPPAAWLATVLAGERP